VLKQYGNVILDLGMLAVPIIHQTVREVIVNIVGFLLDSVQAAGHTDTVNEMLLAENNGEIMRETQPGTWHYVRTTYIYRRIYGSVLKRT
jgi:hypothetical protein